MADQEKNRKNDEENLDPVLDEDSFSLDLDDFDLGEEEPSPGMDVPSLDDFSQFDDDDQPTVGGLGDELLDIDLDSDLDLLDDDHPLLMDDDINADFSEYEEEEVTPEPKPIQTKAKPNVNLEEDLELEFDDDILDLDKEIESILNGEDGILQGKTKPPIDEEGPLSLSLEELENITGSSEDLDLPEQSLDEPDFSLLDEHTDLELDLEEAETNTELDLDLDDSEVDTHLGFTPDGTPELDLTEYDAPAEIQLEEDFSEVKGEEDFVITKDPEEEELFGSAKEDANLTLSDEELGNILGSGTSLEENLGSEDEFLESEPETDFHFDDKDESFNLLGDDDSLSLDPDDFASFDFDPPITESEKEEEPITLSMDELSAIESFDTEMPEETEADVDENIFSEEIDDESITLSPDELGSIIAGDEESTDEHEFEGLEGALEETEEDDGPIALSLEELESIAGEALHEEDNSEDEFVDSLDRAPLPYEEVPTEDETSLLTEDEEDESIALSLEELENITSTSEEEAEESEPITLSDENLQEILGAELPGDTLDDIAVLPEEDSSFLSEMPEDNDLVEVEGDLDFLSEPPSLGFQEDGEGNKTPTLALDESAPLEIDLDEYALEGQLSPLEELRNSEIPKLDSKTDDSMDAGLPDGLSPEERKKVLGYLDELLGNLPDNLIKEFSKSQYFELYKKMMKELEL